jgi:PAS domain S-box-containing protein
MVQHQARQLGSDQNGPKKLTESGIPLTHSQKYFATLVENAFDIILVLDAGGTITYINPAGEKALGHSADNLVGRKAFDFLLPEDVKTAMTALGERVAAPRFGAPTEVRVRNAQGSERYFEASGNNLLNDPEIKGIIVIARDITDRKRAEEALQRSEEKLQTMFESLTDGITRNLEETLCKLIAPHLAFTVLIVHKNVEKNAFDFMQPEISPGQDCLNTTLEKGRQSVEFNMLHKSGCEFLAGLTAAQDGEVTEGFIANQRHYRTKTAEAALRQSEAMYRLI